jgi:hypothetical protein
MGGVPGASGSAPTPTRFNVRLTGALRAACLVMLHLCPCSTGTIDERPLFPR